jgi:hypothetical protein
MRRPLLRVLGVASVSLGGLFAVSGTLIAASGGVASATAAYNWTGSDEVNVGNSSWSDAANWAAGKAPKPNKSVDVAFPELSCATGCGNNPNNDVNGLSVPNLSLALGAETGNGDYNISGNSIKIGAFDVTTSGVPNGTNEQGAGVFTPLTLLGSENWSVDIENNSNLDFGKVTGAKSDSLAVALPIGTANNSAGFINFPSINTGPLTFTGSGGISYVTGGDFNSTTDEPVTFKNVGLFVIGPGGTTKATTTTKYGPLTLTGAQVQFGNGGNSGQYGINSVDGDATLNAKTNLSFNSLEPGTGATPTPGVNYPQLVSTATVKLGSAQLYLNAACNQTTGTKYTIVSGKTISGTFKNLPSGTTFQMNGDGQTTSCEQPGATAPYVTIKYTSTAVTVTVVAPPPGAAQVSTTSHAPSLVRAVGRAEYRFVG